jgi:Thrombospondin type 3 repeat
MSRGTLLPLLLLAACSFNSPDDSGSDGDDDPGPDPDPADTDGDGVVADDNCPSMPNPDQKDDDKDGVGDACDNCPAVANPLKETLGADAPIQRDHDGDGRGDECDLCPHLSGGTSDMDGDSDKIGDACDPEPLVANPAPYWNGFYEPPDATWEPAGVGSELGDWELQLRDNKLGWRQKVLDDGRHQLLYKTAQQEHHVQSSIIGEAFQNGANTSSATVTYGYGGTDTNAAWFSCGPRHNRAGNTDVIISAVQSNDIDEDLGTGAWSGGFLGKAIAVTGRGDRVGGTGPKTGTSSHACSASDGTATSQAMTTSLYIPDGRTGLRTYAMTAWFDYIFIVEPRSRP